MSDCPHCSNFVQVARDAEAANAEQRDQIIALTRALADARRGETNAKVALHRQHKEAEEANAIRSCLKVWEEHCYAGKGKPSSGLDGKRAGNIRKALGYERIEVDDICDAFRGLGLLPYEGAYAKRSPTPKPGFKRKADVETAVRVTRDGLDEARLERFRDYYRRVQSSEVERRRELYMEVQLCADQHLAAFGEQARFEQMLANGRPKAGGSLSPSLIDRMQRALEIALGTSYRGDLRMLAMIASLVAEQSAWDEFVAPVEAQERGHLFVIEGGQAA